MELVEILNRIAEHIVDIGTQAECRTLGELAFAAREACPGAAAALVDWDGSEIARLRAFGIVHGVVLRDLAPAGQFQLLTNLGGSADLVLAG